MGGPSERTIRTARRRRGRSEHQDQQQRERHAAGRHHGQVDVQKTGQVRSYRSSEPAHFYHLLRIVIIKDSLWPIGPMMSVIRFSIEQQCPDVFPARRGQNRKRCEQGQHAHQVAGRADEVPLPTHDVHQRGCDADPKRGPPESGRSEQHHERGVIDALSLEPRRLLIPGSISGSISVPEFRNPAKSCPPQPGIAPGAGSMQRIHAGS